MESIAKNKLNISIFILLLFHASAIVGILFTDYDNFFIQNTPLNIIITTLLLLWNSPDFSDRFLLFFSICFVAGMVFEIIGVNTGYLFGNYSYGKTLGIKLLGVPLIMGLLWFTTTYCCGVLTDKFKTFLETKTEKPISNKTAFFSLIIDASLAAVVLDYVMEPIATQFNYWQWLPNNEIPIFNYICWFFCSLALQVLYRTLRFKKDNSLATHLYFIQILFFLTLRVFYQK